MPPPDDDPGTGEATGTTDEAASLHDAIDALYRGPAADFVAGRNALVKALKGRGAKEDASRVKTLTRPSLSAFAVNRLWWDHRADFDVLLEAGERVRAAIAAGAGPAEQATAGRARREALGRLIGHAHALLEADGHAAAAGTIRRITTSLEAAAAHGRDQPVPGPGRLSDDLEPPGFDTLAGSLAAGVRGAASSTQADAPAAAAGETGGLAAMLAGSLARDDETASGGTPAAANDPVPAAPHPAPPPDAPATVSRADKARAKARAAHDAAVSAVEVAARAVDDLARECDGRTLAANEATTAFEAAEQRKREAIREAESAELAALRADKAARAAADALTAAQRKLADAEAELGRTRDAVDALPEP